jgi:DNA-directed RNA polymerase subunit alpha
MLNISIINNYINKDFTHYGSFIIDPLNIGQGITLGNILRRTLLNDLTSYSITSFKLNNIKNEYIIVPNIREDILEIIFNLKQIIFKESFLNFKINNNKLIKAYLKTSGPKIITSSLFNLPKNNIKIVNSNQYLFTLINDSNIYLEINIEKGNGYKINNNLNIINEKNHFIEIDSNFIPVKNVNFKIKLIYDSYGKIKESLFFEILSNGSITPLRALQESFKLIINLFSNLILKNNLLNLNNI